MADEKIVAQHPHAGGFDYGIVVAIVGILLASGVLFLTR